MRSVSEHITIQTVVYVLNIFFTSDILFELIFCSKYSIVFFLNNISMLALFQATHNLRRLRLHGDSADSTLCRKKSSSLNRYIHVAGMELISLSLEFYNVQGFEY